MVCEKKPSSLLLAENGRIIQPGLSIIGKTKGNTKHTAVMNTHRIWLVPGMDRKRSYRMCIRIFSAAFCTVRSYAKVGSGCYGYASGPRPSRSVAPCVLLLCMGMGCVWNLLSIWTGVFLFYTDCALTMTITDQLQMTIWAQKCGLSHPLQGVVQFERWDWAGDNENDQTSSIPRVAEHFGSRKMNDLWR